MQCDPTLSDIITFLAWMDGNHGKSYSMDKLVEYQQSAMKIISAKPDLAYQMVQAVASGQLDTTQPPTRPQKETINAE